MAGRSRCGIVVFADDEVEANADAPILPSNMRAGDPCKHGHADSAGRGIRYAANSVCVGCDYTRKGRPFDGELDAIIGRALARERRLAAEAARPKRTGHGHGLHKIPTGKTSGSNPAAAKRDTGIACARPGCSVQLTRIAAEHGDPYCSRVCAAPKGHAIMTETEARMPGLDGVEDPSDAALEGE